MHAQKYWLVKASVLALWVLLFSHLFTRDLKATDELEMFKIVSNVLQAFISSMLGLNLK